jgi:hypothetical protein
LSRFKNTWFSLAGKHCTQIGQSGTASLKATPAGRLGRIRATAVERPLRMSATCNAA